MLYMYMLHWYTSNKESILSESGPLTHKHGDIEITTSVISERGKWCIMGWMDGWMDGWMGVMCVWGCGGGGVEIAHCGYTVNDAVNISMATKELYNFLYHFHTTSLGGGGGGGQGNRD